MPSSTSANPYDVIIVAGAAQSADGSAGPAMKRRVLHAVELLKQKAAPMVLMSGGCTVSNWAECDTMAALAIELGVNDQQIIGENRSGSTLENAAYCAEILRSRNLKTALLVTDDFHMRRALYTFRAFGIEVDPAAVGVPLTPLSLLSMARELIARIVYPRRLRHYLATHQPDEEQKNL